MFDYSFAELGMPFVMCPKCNNKMIFHGSWYPKEVVCQNCGCEVNLKNSLKKLTYPNRKYDERGYATREENKVEEVKNDN